MTRKPIIVTSASALAGLLSLLASSPIAARPSDEGVPFAAEIESCIAQVNAHLDLASAERVRHFVSDAERTGIGYALTIETSVLLENAAGTIEKHYEAYCIARGANEPSTFRIEEIEA